MSNILYRGDIDGGPGRAVITYIGKKTARVEVFDGDTPVYVIKRPLTYEPRFGIDIGDLSDLQGTALMAWDEYKESQSDNEN